MTKKELIRSLESVPDDQEIMILDGFNGQGIPREINFGLTNYIITKDDARETDDCDGKVGKEICIIGYGCY